MRFVRVIILAIFLAAAFTTASAREVVNLNKGWLFGRSLVRADLYDKVNLPHSWTKGEHPALMSYLREVMIPADWNGKTVYIRFNGVAGETALYVNGQYVGKHEEAFSAFTFDITRNLRPGARNSILLYVRADTRIDMMPLGGGRVSYAGIFRDVELIVTEKEHISATHYSSDGVYVTTLGVDDDCADLSIEVMLTGGFGDKTAVAVSIKDDSGTEVVSAEVPATIGTNGTTEVTVPVTVNNPRLWNGIYDPYLYSVEVGIKGAKGSETDRVTQRFGIRTVAVDRDKGFMLNGHPYKLYGVLLEEEGAMTKSDIIRDMAFVRELGATAVRFAYGTHDDFFYTLCDEAGIVVWSDIPFYGDEVLGGAAFINTFDFRNSGMVQLKAMVWQYYNHPSVAFWGLFSNLAGGGENPVEYIRELNETAKLISPDRLTVGVSNQDGAINSVTDVISFSQYLGWRKGKLDDLSTWLNSMRTGWRNIKPAIGEYGFGGDPRAFGGNNSERAQLNNHARYLQMLNGRDYIWGYYVNALADYTSEEEAYMGLVTADRSYKKDAFYLYKAAWNNIDKFVHIAGKSDAERGGTTQRIEVVTNLQNAELFVNGKSAGTVETKGGLAAWPAVKLERGANRIKAVSGNYSDETTIYISREI